MPAEKTYHIVTFGCQMNKSEAERLAAVLERLGWVLAPAAEQADLVVLNACSVRQSAIDRVYGCAKNLREQQRAANRQLILALTGCVLPNDQRQLSPRFDVIFQMKNINQLVDFLAADRLETEEYFDILPKYKNPFQAYVPIMTGCNNFCTYCCVPYTRGREVSRPVKSIMAEITQAARRGCLEICLLGQNVNTYNPPDPENFQPANPYSDYFAKLIWEVNNVAGIDRIFYTAAHPKDMTDEVIDTFNLPKVLNYLHLALQAGDDRILQRMNRGYTAADYAAIIAKLRAVKPAIALGTDLIVGFPGETEQQFQNTYDFYQQIRFDISYTAMYSPRAGTPAAKMGARVDLAVKKYRWRTMQQLMEKITLEKNQVYAGQTLPVLVDDCQNGVCQGNSRENKRVRFAGSRDLIGRITAVKIERALTWILDGRVI